MNDAIKSQPVVPATALDAYRRLAHEIRSDGLQNTASSASQNRRLEASAAIGNLIAAVQQLQGQADATPVPAVPAPDRFPAIPEPLDPDSPPETFEQAKARLNNLEFALHDLLVSLRRELGPVRVALNAHPTAAAEEAWRRGLVEPALAAQAVLDDQRSWRKPCPPTPPSR